MDRPQINRVNDSHVHALTRDDIGSGEEHGRYNQAEAEGRKMRQHSRHEGDGDQRQTAVLHTTDTMAPEFLNSSDNFSIPDRQSDSDGQHSSL